MTTYDEYRRQLWAAHVSGRDRARRGDAVWLVPCFDSAVDPSRASISVVCRDYAASSTSRLCADSWRQLVSLLDLHRCQWVLVALWHPRSLPGASSRGSVWGYCSTPALFSHPGTVRRGECVAPDSFALSRGVPRGGIRYDELLTCRPPRDAVRQLTLELELQQLDRLLDSLDLDPSGGPASSDRPDFLGPVYAADLEAEVKAKWTAWYKPVLAGIDPPRPAPILDTGCLDMMSSRVLMDVLPAAAWQQCELVLIGHRLQGALRNRLLPILRSRATSHGHTVTVHKQRDTDRYAPRWQPTGGAVPQLPRIERFHRGFVPRYVLLSDHPQILLPLLAAGARPVRGRVYLDPYILAALLHQCVARDIRDVAGPFMTKDPAATRPQQKRLDDLRAWVKTTYVSHSMPRSLLLGKRKRDSVLDRPACVRAIVAALDSPVTDRKNPRYLRYRDRLFVVCALLSFDVQADEVEALLRKRAVIVYANDHAKRELRSLRKNMAIDSVLVKPSALRLTCRDLHAKGYGPPNEPCAGYPAWAGTQSSSGA